jgi:DNA modification methylase
MNNNKKPGEFIPCGVVHGDCLKVLPTLPRECIDAVITDPPYLGRYKDRTGRTLANDDKPSAVVGVYAELYRVLKPNSFCVTFYGYPKLDAFVHAWTEAGFDTVGHIVWTKPYASSSRFVRVTHESAYILAKGQPQKPARLLDDVQPWEYTGNVAHPTEKAISVIKPLVETFSPPGGLVLDPFSGSGSTAVAAALAGRLYVGIELEEEYCQLARRRLGGVERFMRRRSQRLTSRPSTRALVPNT